MKRFLFCVRDRESHVFTSGVIVADSQIKGLQGYSDFCEGLNKAIEQNKQGLDPRSTEFVQIGVIEENGKICETNGIYIANGSNFAAKLKSALESLPADEMDF